MIKPTAGLSTFNHFLNLDMPVVVAITRLAWLLLLYRFMMDKRKAHGGANVMAKIMLTENNYPWIIGYVEGFSGTKFQFQLRISPLEYNTSDFLPGTFCRKLSIQAKRPNGDERLVANYASAWDIKPVSKLDRFYYNQVINSIHWLPFINEQRSTLDFFFGNGTVIASYPYRIVDGVVEILDFDGNEVIFDSKDESVLELPMKRIMIDLVLRKTKC